MISVSHVIRKAARNRSCHVEAPGSSLCISKNKLHDLKKYVIHIYIYIHTYIYIHMYIHPMGYMTETFVLGNLFGKKFDADDISRLQRAAVLDASYPDASGNPARPASYEYPPIGTCSTSESTSDQAEVEVHRRSLGAWCTLVE